LKPPAGIVTLVSDTFSDRQYRRLVRGQSNPMVPPMMAGAKKTKRGIKISRRGIKSSQRAA
jgi:hypothetical protein